MRYLHYIFTLSLFIFLIGCFGADNKADNPGSNRSLDDLTESPTAKITHENGWTIVSKMEDKDRVYWFLAPEVDNVSPAMFKKIIFSSDKSELETKTVSECEAPRQTCDDLMKQFKVLSEKYK